MSVFILGMNLNKPINCDRLAARPGTGDKALAIFADYHDMKANTPGHRPVIARSSNAAPWANLTPAPGGFPRDAICVY